MPPRSSQSSKLFHAVVSLGVAAAGCGSQSQSNNATTGSDSGEKNASSASASSDAAPDAATGPDADLDAADTGNPIDAALAEDVAADVAEETWIVPPIR